MAIFCYLGNDRSGCMVEGETFTIGKCFIFYGCVDKFKITFVRKCVWYKCYHILRFRIHEKWLSSSIINGVDAKIVVVDPLFFF